MSWSPIQRRLPLNCHPATVVGCTTADPPARLHLFFCFFLFVFFFIPISCFSHFKIDHPSHRIPSCLIPAGCSSPLLRQSSQFVVGLLIDSSHRFQPCARCLCRCGYIKTGSAVQSARTIHRMGLSERSRSRCLRTSASSCLSCLRSSSPSDRIPSPCSNTECWLGG